MARGERGHVHFGRWRKRETSVDSGGGYVCRAGAGGAGHGGLPFPTASQRRRNVEPRDLWTRTDTLRTSRSRSSTTRPCTPKAFQGQFKTTAARDGTVKIDATGLSPTRSTGTDSRRTRTSATSGRSARAEPSTPANVKFTYSGDSDGTRVDGVPAFNNFEVLRRAQDENGDFFVYIGDTIYADSSFRPRGPATTLDEYRGAHKENRGYPDSRTCWRRPRPTPRSTTTRSYNDYDGQTVDPARYAAGRGRSSSTTRSARRACCTTRRAPATRCTGRSSGAATSSCSCSTSARAAAPRSRRPCHGDLGPTLPTAIRTQFPFNLFLAPSPPPGCLNAINDPARTMLGPVQKAKFEQDLPNSTAQYKMVVSEDPIQQFYVLPYDRWEGYGAERAEHPQHDPQQRDQQRAVPHHGHARDAPEPGVPEQVQRSAVLVTSPRSRTRWSRDRSRPTRSRRRCSRRLAPTALFAVNAVLNLMQIDCRNLNQNSYASWMQRPVAQPPSRPRPIRGYRSRARRTHPSIAQGRTGHRQGRRISERFEGAGKSGPFVISRHERRPYAASDTSRCSSNSLTHRGSNCVPAFARSSASASSVVIGRR